jgi:hypothetical protein
LFFGEFLKSEALSEIHSKELQFKKSFCPQNGAKPCVLFFADLFAFSGRPKCR